MAEGEHWFRKNWTTPVLLLGVFLVALFLRAYFPWELAFPSGLLSGGSDSFYYHRIIQYIAETGHHLTSDPRLNFPIGLDNPRPPLYAWSTAVAGKFLSLFFPSLQEAVTAAFLSSTAIWGALTIFPLYFLTKEAFGRRVGVLAAFFLAVLPAHLQRSPATNGDHDAIVLFFVVSAFFFFLKSLKSLHERRWVNDWRLWQKGGRASFREGIGVFYAENRASLLYAMLAGWCMTAIALTWQGWAYAPIILLVYFLFQVLVHRLRNQDPMGVTIAFGVASGLPLLFAAPWYFGTYGMVKTWFDVPLYLYFVALGIGFVFTVTRDYPWSLVLPLFAVGGGSAFAVASLFNPTIAAAFLSGAGYFVRTKAYETIAEAQPPGLSQIILSFGVATYFLALFGLLWLARGIPKHPTPEYLVVVVWAIAAIFMAQAAARFIFNASPAFAMASAWVAVLFLDWFRFDDMRKTFRSLGSGFTGFRRSIRIRHVLGSLFVLFILLLPNVWFGVDASIPFERKAEYDRQVYQSLPGAFRPAAYNQVTQTGGSFYFGAFGYSLPLPREYFPAAWAWFHEVDSGINPVEKRPAFLSWWDYGFEAVDVGGHPTVADNFLDGYHLAGTFITAQSEAEAIALLNLRLLEGDFYKGRRYAFGDEAKAVITSVGLSWPPLETAFRTPQAYVDTVMGDPNRYGKYEGLQPANAKYIWGSHYLTDSLSLEQLASMNNALRRVVGGSIRYFAVDTRLFPLDGENTGIFYAPAKLSDHRILELRDGRSIPRDFFDVLAVTQGRGSVPIQQVRDTDTVTDLTLRYKDLFYHSMFYRAFAGFPPSVAGQSCTDCIPGLPAPNNAGMANILPMQGWNLSHFRVVYKTAYYNPFPREDLANHTDAWRAVESKVAQDLQGKINRGEATGVVDSTPASLIRRGIVFLKYYDGAFLNGTVRVDGVPWPKVRVTVHDDYDVPHDTTVTDADGRYSVLLPFGKVHVAFSLGTPDNRTLTGSKMVGELRLDVSDEAAMREDVDADGDGVPDWRIQRDVDVPGATRSGSVFVDVDGDGKLSPGEPRVSGADLTFEGTNVNLVRSARTAADGSFRMAGLYAGSYNATIAWQGRTLSLTNITVETGQSSKDLALVSTSIEGRALDPAGRGVAGASVNLKDLTNGTTFSVVATSNGSFAFRGLLAGTFELDAARGDQASLPSRASIASSGTTVHQDLTVYPTASLSVRTTLGGTPQGFVTLTFEQRSSQPLVRVVTTDVLGKAIVPLPLGTWDVSARHYAGTSLWAFVGSVTATAGQPAILSASLTPGATVAGLLFNENNRSELLSGAELTFRAPSGQLRVRADLTGRYLAYLPLGTWTARVSYRDLFVNEVKTITGNAVIDFAAKRGSAIQGTVLRKLLGTANGETGSAIRDATVQFFDADRTFETLTSSSGGYLVVIPSTGSFALRVTRPGFLTLTLPSATPFEWQTRGGRLLMAAEDVVVSGTLTLGGSPLADPNVQVVFEALDIEAVRTVASLDGLGRYTVGLQPGGYRPTVDRNLTAPGDTRLQTRDILVLSLPIDSGPRTQDLELVVRHQVGGTVTLGGQPQSTVVRFEGPDVREANTTSGSFSSFLAEGAYTVTANVTQGDSTYLALQRIEVAGPMTISVALLLATNVTGSVTFGVAPIEGVPIVFTRTEGAAVTATSDAFGQYHVLLLGGAYAASVDHAATVPRGDGVQYVRYSFEGSLSVGQSIRIFNIGLSRALDNTTVTGTIRFLGAPVLAQVSFVARANHGLNATVSSAFDGQFTLAMQGGEYSVYALAPLEGAAFLGKFSLPSGAPTTFDLSLVQGIRLSGVTSISGSRRSANVTFAASGNLAQLTSDGTGSYSILLPEDSYDVRATTPGTERGIAVSYQARRTIVLTDPLSEQLDMKKVGHRAVDLTVEPRGGTAVVPAGALDYDVTVTNGGNEDDRYDVTASVAGFTFSFSQNRVSVPFGSTGNIRTIRLTVTAAKDARVDHPPITVVATSTADSSVTKTVSLKVDVSRYRGLAADVSSSAPTWDGRFLDYTLEVRNEGNGQETFQLTLPNEDELRASGWRATFAGATAGSETVLSITVGANSTMRPVLRLQKAGGTAGATARVLITNTQDGTESDLVTVRVQLPALSLEGRIRAIGADLSVNAPSIDIATTAFLISAVAAIGAGVYLALLRRRSR